MSRTPTNSGHVLDCTETLEDFADGFISITDPRLAHKETAIAIFPEQRTETLDYRTVNTALFFERTVYKVKFSGGGSLTARIKD
ncbi:E4 ORF6/7 [Tree shrew adenovirus 1]|uniref:E4 ORF6/7 n=1 Tax=Tree shrew adenovirus serotype 1 TaxID=47680 RepID=A0A2U9AG96_ADET1|nr:E4 ORF6/7 [Tree shrew adenovirus 1]